MYTWCVYIQVVYNQKEKNETTTSNKYLTPKHFRM